MHPASQPARAVVGVRWGGVNTLMARGQKLPVGGMRTLAAVVRGTMLRGLDELEFRFTPAFERRRDARVAAGVFAASVGLLCAGVFGAFAVGGAPSVIDVHRGPVAEAAEAGPASGPAEVVDGPPGGSGRDRAGRGRLAAGAKAAAAPTTTAQPAPAPVAPPGVAVLDGGRGALPIGKGMWIWMHDRASGGDPVAIVERAKVWGLTHIYVRTATYKEGFMAGPFLDRLLPVAHANGIRVYGWDFPYMTRPGDDVNRALAAITYRTPDGHRIDGFAPDIETKHEGVNESLEHMTAYVTWLRQNVGDDYPLIAVIPNPTPGRVARGYPFAQIVAPFDAVAPMVYWMDRDPAAEVTQAIGYLKQFGKPVFPVGQAYDGSIDGGAGGMPSRDALIRFMQAADAAGADSVSFWSWQHASEEAWNAIGDAMEFRLGHGGPEELRPSMIRAYQLELSRLGFPVGVSGEWTLETVQAVSAFQRSVGLPQTGVIDFETRRALLAPIAAKVRPYGH
jgi:hypothetical protein